MCSPLCHSATSLARQMSWTAAFSSLCSVLHLLHILVDVALQPAADLTQQYVPLPTAGNTLELEYNTNLISMQVTKQKVGWAVYPSAKNDAFVSMFHKKLKQHKHINPK